MMHITPNGWLLIYGFVIAQTIVFPLYLLLWVMNHNLLEIFNLLKVLNNVKEAREKMNDKWDDKA